MLRSDDYVVRLARWVALTAALAIAIGAPAGYFYFSYQHHKTVHTAQALNLTKPLERLISLNPHMWSFKDEGLVSILSQKNIGFSNVRHRVIRLDGSVVIQYPGSMQPSLWPDMAVRKDLLDHGRPVATLEITHSSRHLMTATLMIAAASTFAGFFIYWFLSVYPLRMLEKSWQRINYLARFDELTGLVNRGSLVDHLNRAIADTARRPCMLIVHYLDLDGFKHVNDSLGHAAGDELLKNAADRMQACTREGDILARLGGDEFVLVQTGVTDPQDAAILAERLIAEVSQPYELDGRKAAIGASIGMAVHSSTECIDAEQLLKNADLALYKSKNAGRGKYHFFQEELDQELRERVALEADLRLALQEEQFELHYQPQLDPASESIIGVEALLRWHHPERGLIPPGIFIPVAEKMGLMLPLTAWVLETACVTGVAWAPLKIAVNVSPSLFQHDDLIEMVSSVLLHSGLPPHRLELEVTEEVLIADPERAILVLEQLKAMGVNIAMDDFGTGYSSLSYMRKFKFDKIKIDRSFVTDIGKHEDAQAIVRAIIGMCRALGMHVNAEGVETREEAAVLVHEGCDEVQGFLYARPVPASGIEKLLNTTNAPTKPTNLAHVA